MDLKPGSRWGSNVCATEVVVVRAPTGPMMLECGGQPMSPLSEVRRQELAIPPDHVGGATAGKRYADRETGLELLCSKSGDGALAVAGRKLEPLDAKKLPSSD